MISSHIGPILWVTGVYTALALPQFFAPRPFLKLLFGFETADPVALLFARHWALLAALVGALLVYAAPHPEVRGPVLTVAAVEKLALAGLLLFGGLPRTGPATRLAVLDAAMALVFLLYFAGA